MQPNISRVQRRARAADKGFQACVSGAPGSPPQCKAVAAMMRAAAANPTLRAAALAQIDSLQLATADGSPRATSATAHAATFKVIVNPLVTWMWIGGLIALAGAAVALWPPAAGAAAASLPSTEIDALKEAKYREIRDAELDHAAGKLSDEDYALLDAELRREAVEILDRIEPNGNGNGHPREPARAVALS